MASRQAAKTKPMNLDIVSPPIEDARRSHALQQTASPFDHFFGAGAFRTTTNQFVGASLSGMVMPISR
jgi:hypothetical protein